MARPPDGERSCMPQSEFRRRRTPPFGLFLTIGILVAALSACSSSGQRSAAVTSSTAPSSSTPASTAPTTASTTPKRATGTPVTPTTVAPKVTRPAARCAATSWPLRTRLAQLVMVGVSPSQPAAVSALVRSTGVGGVFVGGNDTKLFASGALRLLAAQGPVPPFVAVDEEGGRVQRIDGLAGSMPSARVMGARMTPAHVRTLAQARGRALRRY